MTTGIAYKFLGPGRLPCHGGSGAWPEPGVWTPRIDRLVPCLFGYHLCRPEHLHDWLGPELWRVEWRGACIDAGDKIVVEQARIVERVEAWNERTARLHACDCAERVVRLTGPDERCLAAIAVARRFAVGEATERELDDAWDAARAAAAAWDAARAAAWAAGAAAWAAGEAAWDAERSWQKARLLGTLGLAAKAEGEPAEGAP